MNDLTTKLAEALRLISFASMDRGARDTAIEALRLYDEATALPVQDLPPLPESVHLYHDAVAGLSEYLYTADQMRDYARAAQAATPAPALYVGLIERLMRLSTRLGIAHEGGVEHFAAGLEDRLYAICRSAESLLDLLAAELEKSHEARRQAQSELAYFKARLASARLTLMRELKEQGWVPAPAPLTDEQIKAEAMEAFDSSWDADDETLVNKYGHGVYLSRFIEFARAVERAHGIGKGKESA